jgi:hypothetical protein
MPAYLQLVPPPEQALHPATPRAVTDALLRSVKQGNSRLRIYDEHDSALTILIKRAPLAGEPTLPRNRIAA